MHEKWKDRCAQVTGGKPPQTGQGREGGRIRNFMVYASGERFYWVEACLAQGISSDAQRGADAGYFMQKR